MEEQRLNFTVDLNAIREAGLFIAMPMYGGSVYGSTASSLMKLAILCTSHGIPLNYKFLYNESLVQRARNYLAASFMSSGCKLFMFIDGDIEFEAQDVLIMADLMLKDPENKAVLAAVYPKKNISWEKIVAAVNKGVADEDPEILENFVGDYAFNALTESFSIAEMVEVAETGTGFMMIHRDTFTAFEQAYPEQQYTPDHARTEDFDGSKKIYAYFDCKIDPESNRYLSEDYYFCNAIRKIGKKVWIAPWMRLKHQGYYTFGGSLGALASIGESATADLSKIKKKNK